MMAQLSAEANFIRSSPPRRAAAPPSGRSRVTAALEVVYPADIYIAHEIFPVNERVSLKRDGRRPRLPAGSARYKRKLKSPFDPGTRGTRVRSITRYLSPSYRVPGIRPWNRIPSFIRLGIDDSPGVPGNGEGLVIFTYPSVSWGNERREPFNRRVRNAK